MGATSSSPGRSTEHARLFVPSLQRMAFDYRHQDRTIQGRSPVTSFIESEALLALLNDDREEAEAQVRKLYPREADALRDACMDLAALCREQVQCERH